MTIEGISEDPLDNLGNLNLFQEPQDFRPPSPKPSQTMFARKPEFVTSGSENLVLHLPPQHSLWAHRLWNAGQSMAHYLDEHKEWYQGKNVLEFGSGAATPSLICAINGAKYVVATDYPDPLLIQNIQKNAQENIPELYENGTFEARGYIWGQNEEDLDYPLTKKGKFDLIIMADVIFNHNQHENLLKSCKNLLAHGGNIFCTYSHHVVKWAHKDDNLFTIAKQDFGFVCEKMFEQRWDPMFPEDTGDLDMRSTVHGWKLYFK